MTDKEFIKIFNQKFSKKLEGFENQFYKEKFDSFEQFTERENLLSSTFNSYIDSVIDEISLENNFDLNLFVFSYKGENFNLKYQLKTLSEKNFLENLSSFRKIISSHPYLIGLKKNRISLQNL